MTVISSSTVSRLDVWQAVITGPVVVLLMGCSPRFNVPGRPQQSGLCERLIGTLKRMISKVAMDHPRSWYNYLGHVLWSLRECPNESTNLPPWVMVYGHLPRGPLAVLKESWVGHRDFPLSLGKTAEDYLADLRQSLEVARSYADTHLQKAQRQYISRYNLRSREKSFTVGEQVLVLIPNTTASKVFSRWQGPYTVTEVKSPHSYMVDVNGVSRHLHADKLRKYHVQVTEVSCDACTYDLVAAENALSHCAIVYEQDQDFGEVEVLNTSDKPDELLPSQKIAPEKLAHLSEKQQSELLTILDKFPDVFSDTPGFCDLVQHEINVTAEFRPKRLPAYRVPESLKPEVQRQIDEMLRLGIIKPSKSQMASPIVCVLKGRDKKDGVRLAIDYRYVNKYTLGDAFPGTDIEDLIQRIGPSRYTSTFDVKGAYWQIEVKPEHQWLTAFVWDGGLYEFTRSPFGQRNSGQSFVRAVQHILRPLKQFADNYVDDMAVFSQRWTYHLEHLEKFLEAIQKSGLTLNIKKCHFAQSEVPFVGHIIGSGQKRADGNKVSAVHKMKAPETKKQLRQILGFFSYFREYIPRFAEIAKPLTDLTSKRVPTRIPWGTEQAKALQDLKDKLCQATTLQVIDFSKPFAIQVDASDYAVAGCLLQPTEDQGDKPVAFISAKLTPTQQAWSTIEKEAYAAVWALKRFRNWIFGKTVTLYTDHNPITFLTESSPKSSKLMRWALAIQEYPVTFRYKPSKNNVVADCLSRYVNDEPESPPG